MKSLSVSAPDRSGGEAAAVPECAPRSAIRTGNRLTAFKHGTRKSVLGYKLRPDKLPPEGFGQPVVLKREAHVDRAGAVAGLVEIHRHTIFVVEPHSHMLVSTSEFTGLDE